MALDPLGLDFDIDVDLGPLIGLTLHERPRSLGFGRIFSVERGAGEGPITPQRPFRAPQGGCRLFVRHPAEKPQHDEFGGPFVFESQAFDSRLDDFVVVDRRRREKLTGTDRIAPAVPAPFEGLIRSDSIDESVPHEGAERREKLAARAHFEGVGASLQLEPSLVYEIGCGDRLTRRDAPQLRVRDGFQFGVSTDEQVVQFRWAVTVFGRETAHGGRV